MNKTSLNDLHLKYIKDKLIKDIITTIKNEDFEDVKIDYSGGLDGFMSALYNIQLKTRCIGEKDGDSKTRFLIVKFMKGDDSFRRSSKSYVQFANEIFIYDKVLPAFDNLLKQANVQDVAVDNWVAHCYVAKYGFVEGFSATLSTNESVLVLENLKPLGYTLGPRLYLGRDELLAMSKPLGQYHALSLAMRLYNAKEFENLRQQIIPLPFRNPEDPEDDKLNLYKVLYRVAFDRFFEYFDRMIDDHKFSGVNDEDKKLIKNINRLRKKYFEEPTKLLEQIHSSIENDEEDSRFGVILHGDYNRNNVLFRYEKSENSGEERGKVSEIKLIDFQELRYGSPAMDLSFYMYFNTPENIRDELWLEMLKSYHEEMLKTLKKTLYGIKLSGVDKILEKYSFEKFNNHFGRFALYGVMICMHFLPWCFSSEEECSQLSHYFETDMHGEEFYKISMTAAGDEVNEKILNVVRHASKMGYMDYL